MIDLLDKKTGQLNGKCPVLHYRKLKASTIERKEYNGCPGNNKYDLLKEMKKDFSKCNIKTRSSFDSEWIPMIKAYDKDKDPEGNPRIITSYARCPLQKCWKLRRSCSGKGSNERKTGQDIAQ